MKNLIFLCIATCIFIFSVIVLNFAPIINGLVGKGKYDLNGDIIDPSNPLLGFSDNPCSSFIDKYNNIKDGFENYPGSLSTQEEKDNYLDQLKDGKSDCLRKKAMAGLEYSAFNIDVIFGFISAILGLLLYSGNNIAKIAGLIGLASGVIGFVLTFVYIIYSGIVFNNDVVYKDYKSGNPYSGSKLATTSDGAVLKFKDNKYVCIFYDKDKKDKLYRKYSNYGNKYLNYYHLNQKDKDDEYYKHTQCLVTSSSIVNSADPTILLIDWNFCKLADESNTQGTKKKIRDENNNEKGECDKLYIYEPSTTNTKNNLYDSWVITIVFGCFIFVLDIGLAIFGFLIFKDSNGSSGAVTIK
jgi:hypothetical protein